MTLAFKASSVSCSSAIGGEILQVCFDTMPESKDEDERGTPYVLISRNFEFPGSATVEWHDGSDYDGGAEIVNELLKYELIDEMIIFTIPILLGAGTRLFQGDYPEQKLELISSKSYESGVVKVHYKKIEK